MIKITILQSRCCKRKARDNKKLFRNSLNNVSVKTKISFKCLLNHQFLLLNGIDGVTRKINFPRLLLIASPTIRRIRRNIHVSFNSKYCKSKFLFATADSSAIKNLKKLGSSDKQIDRNQISNQRC